MSALSFLSSVFLSLLLRLSEPCLVLPLSILEFSLGLLLGSDEMIDGEVYSLQSLLFFPQFHFMMYSHAS